MTTLRRICAATFLSLALAGSVLAGQIETTGKTGQIETPGKTDTTSTTTTNVVTVIVVTVVNSTY